MPMNVESVMIYLGIVLCGCVVASIADSFAPPEIQTRLRVSNSKLIFTQVDFLRTIHNSFALAAIQLMSLYFVAINVNL